MKEPFMRSTLLRRKKGSDSGRLWPTCFRVGGFRPGTSTGEEELHTDTGKHAMVPGSLCPQGKTIIADSVRAGSLPLAPGFKRSLVPQLALGARKWLCRAGNFLCHGIRCDLRLRRGSVRWIDGDAALRSDPVFTREGPDHDFIATAASNGARHVSYPGRAQGSRAFHFR